eukprot:CAMPEP_0182534512 /NCGR_PEP_ID=MMETSP1323-20130603/15895_1 /TAXON_ID=236787 /ORGANISM="Florenciella parvula, Strain RCC1693" /LENGTH=380 /DNA_ID=CAMNT_0024744535 /DNA_START=163 /DNA_END=1305 /DNA_ORIENTATION=-
MNSDELRAIRTARASLLPLNQRTAESTTVAQGRDKKTHAELNDMRHMAINTTCADCAAKHPGWAALPHGVFLCIDCAQIHRGIGRHISQVKCISSHTYLWYPDEVAIMKTMGNERAKQFFGMAQRPTSASDHASRVKFAKDKYETMKWAPDHDAMVVSAPAGAEATAEARSASTRASASSGASRFERKREAAKRGNKARGGLKTTKTKTMAAVPMPLDSTMPTMDTMDTMGTMAMPPSAPLSARSQPAVDLLTPRPAPTSVPAPAAGAVARTAAGAAPVTVTRVQPMAGLSTADAHHAAQVSSIMNMYSPPTHTRTGAGAGAGAGVDAGTGTTQMNVPPMSMPLPMHTARRMGPSSRAAPQMAAVPVGGGGGDFFGDFGL